MDVSRLQCTPINRVRCNGPYEIGEEVEWVVYVGHEPEAIGALKRLHDHEGKRSPHQSTRTNRGSRATSVAFGFAGRRPARCSLSPSARFQLMSNPMDVSSIAEYINKTYAAIYPVAAWGETSWFYNPDQKLPRGIYFATIKEKDGDNDRASNLDRPDVFRLSIGISKSTYRSIFGPQPPRPEAGGVVHAGHDFTVLDRLTPHPVYGWMSWVCVLNPSTATFDTIKPLLSEAYGLAADKFVKRTLRA